MPEREADFFGEPIYTYTDAQAIEDGVLVAIPGDGNVNRATRAVFDHYANPMGESQETNAVTNITPLLEAIRALLTKPPDTDGWRTGTHEGKELWIIPNEVGGLTLMFPDDY